MTQPSPAPLEGPAPAVTTEIAEYRPIAAALHELYSRHAGVVHDVTTTKGMQACREARAEIRTCRTSLEAKRTEIKAPALERCRLIDADAKRITEALLAIEEPLDEQIKAEEDAIELRREAKRRAEMERLARLNQIVADIHGWPLDAAGASPQELREHIQTRESISLEAFPEEIRRECGEAKEEALRKLREMLAASKAREAEDARLAAERAAELERQAAEDKRLREERQRLEAERQENEARAAEERADLDRQQVEHARIKRELSDERARINHEREDRGLAPHPPPGTWPEPSEPSLPQVSQVQAAPGTTLMRVRFEKIGGHYHCRVFTTPRPGTTYEKCGDLVFREAEWRDIPLLMRGAEFVEEVSQWP